MMFNMSDNTEKVQSFTLAIISIEFLNIFETYSARGIETAMTFPLLVVYLYFCY